MDGINKHFRTAFTQKEPAISRLVLSLLAVGLIIFGIGAAGAAGDDSDREKELRAEIAKLRQRIKVLEDRLKALESQSAKPTEPPMTFRWAPSLPSPTVQPYAPSPDRLPEGTIEREFNGMKYYIIPIADIDDPALNRTAPVLAPAALAH